MRRDWLNLPNVITLLRIAAVPMFLAVLFAEPDKQSPWRWLAVLLFVAAIATDGVDGAIARKRNLVTDLGKLLDPIADKVLLGGALVALSLLGEVHWAFTALILVREVALTVYRMLVIRERVVAANSGGKVKTIMQGITVGFLLSPLDLYWPPLASIELVALYLTTIVTLVTGFQYLWAARRATSVTS
jgi:CDP-diacylglycerol--glycerol-3-phosphate 3-phosphatidyltransferase